MKAKTKQSENEREIMSHKMYDVKCPSCNAELRINHDDGCGYSEDEWHQQECSKCLKIFAYTTSIHFYYHAKKADCLNDGKHKYEPTRTIPIEAAVLRCKDCGDEKPLEK